jgi:hypothetical protein
MDDHAIIETVVEKLRGEFGADLLGVLAGGSRLRGHGDPSSDLDLVVVVALPRRQRRNLVVAGIEVEMFINPFFQVQRYFDQDRRNGRGVMPHLCSTGHIVFDPQRTMAALQTEARAIWDAGPAPPSDIDRWYFRYGAADMLRDIEDVMTSDTQRAAFLIGAWLPQLIDQHYRIAGRWIEKRKRVLDDLARWDKTASDLARQVNDGACSVRERQVVIRTLAEHILAPLGGLMPRECHTEWEELSPEKKEARGSDA